MSETAQVVRSAAQLARALGRSKAALSKWMRRPDWPFVRPGPAAEWNVADVLAWARRTLVGESNRPVGGAASAVATPAMRSGLDGGAEVGGGDGDRGRGERRRAGRRAALEDELDEELRAADREFIRAMDPITRAKLDKIIKTTAKIDLEIAIRSGHYVRRDDWEEANVARVVRVRAALTALPNRVRTHLDALDITTQERTLAAIRGEIERILNDFAGGKRRKGAT